VSDEEEGDGKRSKRRRKQQIEREEEFDILKLKGNVYERAYQKIRSAENVLVILRDGAFGGDNRSL